MLVPYVFFYPVSSADRRQRHLWYRFIEQGSSRAFWEHVHAQCTRRANHALEVDTDGLYAADDSMHIRARERDDIVKDTRFFQNNYWLVLHVRGPWSEDDVCDVVDKIRAYAEEYCGLKDDIVVGRMGFGLDAL